MAVPLLRAGSNRGNSGDSRGSQGEERGKLDQLHLMSGVISRLRHGRDFNLHPREPQLAEIWTGNGGIDSKVLGASKGEMSGSLT